MKTVTQVAVEMGLSRARVHQLIQALDIKPKRLEGAYGTGFVYYLSSEDVAKLVQTKRIVKPTK